MRHGISVAAVAALAALTLGANGAPANDWNHGSMTVTPNRFFTTAIRQHRDADDRDMFGFGVLCCAVAYGNPAPALTVIVVHEPAVRPPRAPLNPADLRFTVESENGVDVTRGPRAR